MRPASTSRNCAAAARNLGSRTIGGRRPGTEEAENSFRKSSLPIGLESWEEQKAQIATTEVSYASYHRNEGSRLQDPGPRRIFRKKYRGRRAERHQPRLKNCSRDEVVRS